MGIGVAFGSKPDKSFFDALADSDEDAAKADKTAEADERERAVMEKYKFK
jgi:hypothetical protein